MKSLKQKLLLCMIGIGLMIPNPGFAQMMELQGAGATFPFPLYSKMFHEYFKQYDIQVNYQGIGSGGGIRQLKNQIVDFGASDAYMMDKELFSLDQDVVHVPICLGAVVMAYNVRIKDLKFTPEIIAGIFNGDITSWQDDRIKAANPTAKLPKLKITPVYRADSSGTTFIFTNYLSKISEKWAKSFGFAKQVKWPAGIAGKGNAGVSGLVKRIQIGRAHV